MIDALTKNVVSQWSSLAVYFAVAGVLLVGVLLGILIFRQRGHRAIAQRLNALASRMAVDPRQGDGKVESALSYLEEVTGAAHNAVSDSNAESVRLRRSLETLRPSTSW